MAQDAVLKVKEAEDKGGSMIRQANEQAKEILQQAESDGNAKYKDIIQNAQNQKQQIIAKAVEDGNKECEPLIIEGQKECQNILQLNQDALDKAVGVVMERIVNQHGNR